MNSTLVIKKITLLATKKATQSVTSLIIDFENLVEWSSNGLILSKD
ncbi:hypothetical protein FM106_19870 [Brachybacterium faecium]|nr:hypothetical protein FM106_19870 [Brachybacterium faecium]